jgi:predicted choloylglycine hydrolase
MDVSGTNYEIGTGLGKMVAGIPPLKALHTQGMQGFGNGEAKEAAELFDRWCPGLTEELRGFADALEVKPEQVFFTAMTYLLPRCSHVALLPTLTAEGKPLVARNYEFSHEAEDFSLVRTSVKGKYTHLGTSGLSFGRDDGLNEHGLSVTMSSCGFPVGALPFMRSPVLKGLQFWAVIRALLENCKDVNEALAYLKGMPIAYNLNLMLADKSGNAALFETLDGRAAFKKISADTEDQLLYATNHAVLSELMPYEPEVMIHSVKRCEYLEQQLTGKTGITREELKAMLLSMYPDGLCFHFYEEYFGTTKSMVISPVDGTIELCWGGRQENAWQTYEVSKPLEHTMRPVELILDKAKPGTFDYQRR